MKVLQAFTLLTFLALMSFNSSAADAKTDVTGTWVWSVPGRDGQSRNATLKLKQEGDKVTGAMAGRNNNETPIQDAKLEGDKISFKVVREFNGNKFTSSYHGKLSGDTITGKMEFERNGEKQSRDWEAKRERKSDSK